jgi:hypothetical protein
MPLHSEEYFDIICQIFCLIDDYDVTSARLVSRLFVATFEADRNAILSAVKWNIASKASLAALRLAGYRALNDAERQVYIPANGPERGQSHSLITDAKCRALFATTRASRKIEILFSRRYCGSDATNNTDTSLPVIKTGGWISVL